MMLIDLAFLYRLWFIVLLIILFLTIICLLIKNNISLVKYKPKFGRFTKPA